MTAQKEKQNHNWDQSAFEAMKAAWSPQRAAANEKLLQEIFDKAEESPLLAQQLEWAQQHGVKFFIDHQAVNCGGYYWPGTGVMAISAKFAGKHFGMEALGHELRHAWQDYHRLIAWSGNEPHTGEFSAFFINNALIEADAYAYGKRAGDELVAAEKKKKGFMVSQFMKASLADENADLGRKFLQWFTGRSHAQSYGDYFSKKFGKKWGIYTGELPARNYEHKPVIEPELPGFDIHDRIEVLRLGENFSGTKNYLAALQPDILPKKILRPSLANTFWNAANPTQKKLTSGLRKAYLKQKLAQKPVKRRHPLP